MLKWYKDRFDMAAFLIPPVWAVVVRLWDKILVLSVAYFVWRGLLYLCFPPEWSRVQWANLPLLVVAMFIFGFKGKSWLVKKYGRFGADRRQRRERVVVILGILYWVAVAVGIIVSAVV